MVRLLVLLIMNLYSCTGFQDVKLPGEPQMETLAPGKADPGEPLYLTPYIEDGAIEEAQGRAQVTLHYLEDIISYSGFLTVNKTYNTNLFFWYFPANGTSPDHNPMSAEVIIYLTSSFFTPEVVSMYGVFQENGPIQFLHGPFGTYMDRREWSLNKYRHVIYIDHMPGMGFSFTENPRGYPDSSMKIGELLYIATLQIFKLFPDLQTKYLSIMGEMVAAKYATALAYIIDQNKSTAEIDIKLQRMYLTSPWINPSNQVGYYHKHFHEIGLIDENTSEVVLSLQRTIQKLIFRKHWQQALSHFFILYRELSKITAQDHMSNFYLDDLVLRDSNLIPRGFIDFEFWISKGSRRKALHVGRLPYKFNYRRESWDALKNDYMQDVTNELTVLSRKGYYIMIANGPLGMVVPFRSSYDEIKNFDDRTNAVFEAVVIDLKNETYLAYLSIGALQNSRTIAVMQPKVGNFPWIDQAELTWNVVDFLHDFVLSGVDDEVSYDSQSKRLIYRNDIKANFNHKFSVPSK